MSAPASTPPGWYADPGGSSALRWWDGAQWTEHLQHQPQAQAPAPQYPAPQYQQYSPYGQPPPTNEGLQWVVPVGRSGLSIAAGYLGIFSICLLPAPVALGVSLVALSQLKKDPQKKGRGRAIFGLVMGGLGTALLLFLLLGGTLGADG